MVEKVTPVIALDDEISLVSGHELEEAWELMSVGSDGARNVWKPGGKSYSSAVAG
jgi:hypothetical protein